MGKKHYSEKELIIRRQMESQQSKKSNIRQRVQDMNRLKKSMEAARQDMRQRSREEKGNGVSD